MKTIIGKNSSVADDLLPFAGINRALILAGVIAERAARACYHPENI